MNCCSVMLNTGRYTWRHNNIINYIVTNVDSSKFKVYSDLPGWEAPGGGSIPSELCLTRLKPDIVIVDEKKKTLHIYELAVPLTMNIDQRHTEKNTEIHTFSHRHHKSQLHSELLRSKFNWLYQPQEQGNSNHPGLLLEEGHQEVLLPRQHQLPGLVWELSTVAHQRGQGVCCPTFPHPTPQLTSLPAA